MGKADILCSADSARIGIKCGSQSVDCLGKVLLLEHISHAHLVVSHAGNGIESGCRSHEDSGAVVAELLKTPSAEILRVPHRKARHTIEGTHGDGREDARNGIETLEKEVSATTVFAESLLQVVVGGIYRRLGHKLSDQWRAQTRLAEFHHGVMELLVAGHERADTYAAFIITLRHGVDDYGLVFYTLKLKGRDYGLVAVAELAVYLVGEEEEVMTLHYVAYLLELLTAVDVSRGIVGVADKYGLGAWSDAVLELLDRRERET